MSPFDRDPLVGGRDPYDELQRQLVLAARAAEPRRSRIVRWVSRHTALALIAGAAVTATATAAVVSGLRGTPSPPVTGAVVGSSPAGSTPAGEAVRAGRYRIAFAPLSRVGYVGWCSHVAILHADRRKSYGGGGCRPAPRADEHVAASGFVGNGDEFTAYFVVDERVGGLRLAGGEVILPRESPAAPEGWRVIVVRSGDASHGEVFDDRDRDRWRLVDRSGASLGAPVYGLSDPSELDVAVQKSRRVEGQTFPPGAQCRIDETAATQWPTKPGMPRRLSVLRGAPVPTTDLVGRAFLTCATIAFPAGQVGYDFAEVLIDAGRPGTRPARLPGMDGPDDGRPVNVTWQFTGGSLGGDDGPTATAQRRGNAWLVVSGDSPQRRLELLQSLKVELNL